MILINGTKDVFSYQRLELQYIRWKLWDLKKDNMMQTLIGEILLSYRLFRAVCRLFNLELELPTYDWEIFSTTKERSFYIQKQGDFNIISIK